MHKSFKFWLGIICAIAIAGCLIWASRRPSHDAGPAGAPLISAFDAESGVFYVTGTGLARVEILSIPTGTGISEKDYQKIGDAALATTTDDGIQVWTLPIPREPFLSAQVFAEGFGADPSAPAARMALPYQGAAEISEALWGAGDLGAGE